MNRIYRLVWNASLGRLVVASELARGRSKNGRRAYGLGVGISCVIRWPLGVLAVAGVSIGPAMAYEVAGASDCNGGNGRIAVGADASACSDFAIALGGNANATAASSIALGRQANTSGDDAIAIGTGSQAGSITVTYDNGTDDQYGFPVGTAMPGVALGARSFVNSGTAIGIDASVGDSNSNIVGTALGANATVTGNRGIAISGAPYEPARAQGLQSIAQGFSALAQGTNSVALGSSASVNGTGSIAVGVNSQGESKTSDLAGGQVVAGDAVTGLAIGSDASANAGVALGQYARADGSTALGSGAYADGTNSLAIGTRAPYPTVASGDAAIAMGNLAESTGQTSIAIGRQSTAQANGAIAQGQGAEANGVSSIAIGSGSTGYQSEDVTVADGGRSIAIGNLANASGGGDVALGENAVAAGNGLSATAVGFGASATGSDAASFGNSVQATGNFSLAVGNLATASELDSIAIGDSAKSSGVNALAIGTLSTASGERSLSIGVGNNVSGAGAGAIGDPSTVSGDGSYSLGNNNVVAADNAGVFGNNNNLGENATGSRVIGNNNGTVDAPLDVADAFVLGNNAAVSVDNSVALGSGSVANGSTLAGLAFQPVDASGNAIPVAGTTPVGVVSVGSDGDERRVTHVAAGSANTDAVNVSQLTAVDDKATYASQGFGLTAAGGNATNVAPGDTLDFATTDGNLAITKNAAEGDTDQVRFALSDDVTLGNSLTITGGPTLDSDGIDVNGGTVSNVADGTAPGDAVNRGQLDTVNALAGRGFDLTAGGENATNVAPGDTLDFADTDGNLTITKNAAEGNTDQVRFALSDDVTLGNSLTITGGPTINSDGINVNNGTISNVADGTAAGDAVNLGQLDEATGGLTSSGLDFSGNSGDLVHRDLGQTLAIRGDADADGTYSGTNLRTVTDPDTGTIGLQMTDRPQFGDITINDGGSGRIGGVADGTAPNDAVNRSQLDEVNTIASRGFELTAGQENATTVAPGDTLDLSNTDGNLSIVKNTADGTTESVAFALSDDVTVGNSLTIADGPTINSDGIDVNNATISNVADGTASGDAVNRGQLDDVTNGLSSSGLDFTGNDGGIVHRDLGNTLAITGDANAAGNYDGTNLRTVTDPDTGTIALQMSDQPQFGDVTINDGDTGRISGVADGTAPGDAVNRGQLDAVGALAGRGFDLTVGGGTLTNVAPGDTLDLANTDGNLSITKNAADGTTESVAFALSDDVAIGNSLTVAGGPTISGNGIDMAGQTISNVGAPQDGDDAVNRDYFEANRTHYYSINDAGNQRANYNNGGATGAGALAAGVNAGASGERAAALGTGAVARTANSVALGAEAVADRAIDPATGQLTTNGDAVIRYNTTNRTLLGAVSVGRSADSADGAAYRQLTNVADGTDAQDAVTIRQLRGAIGSIATTGSMYFHANSAEPDSLATGEDSIAVGPNTQAGGDNGIGIGNNALVEEAAAGGTAIGMNTRVALPDAVALGTNAVAAGEQSLALGAGAEASQPASIALGGNSVTAPVVATTTGTVNGATYDYAGGNPAGTLSLGGTKTVTNDDGSTTTIDQSRTVTNVAAGRVTGDSTDAINGSQLYATNQAVGTLGNSLTSLAGDTSADYVEANGRGIRYVRTNESGLDTADAFAQTPGSTAVGYRARTTAGNALALGRNAQASQAGSVALGANATTESAVGTSGARIGGQRYGFAGTNPVATVSVGSAGNERTVTNVAAGRINAESTDAINGSQLYSTNQAVDSVTGRVTEVEGQVATVQGDVENLDGRVTTVEGDVDNLGNQIGALGDRAVQYDTNPDGSVNRGAITLNGDNGTTITNVAAGDVAEDSTDAVNGGQLWNVQNQIGDIQAGNTRYVQVDGNGGSAAVASGDGSVALGSGSQATGDHSVAQGENAQVASNGGVALGAGSKATREGMDGAKEAFSGQTVVSTQGAVSVGSTGGERQITHVAGGTEDTDAVNVRQLASVQAGSVNYDRNPDGSVDYTSVTLGNGNAPAQVHNVAPGTANTDAANVGQLKSLGRSFGQALGNVNRRIDEVKDQADAGTASAIAIASVPQATLPGKGMTSLGVGTYNGESALAVGVSRLSDNGHWAVKLNGTANSQNSYGGGVGVGFHW